MDNTISNEGVATYVTVTGTVCITSGPAHLFGILVHGTGTGGFQLFSGNTSSAANALTGALVTYATVTGATANAGVMYNFNSIALPTGFTVIVKPTADPKTTIFWAPMGTGS